MEDVYGLWYGVGYAQHTPDMTNKPKEVGCVILKNYSDENWRSYKSNPWSDTPLAGSWLDIRLKRNAQQEAYIERRLRVLWDEDGQTMEQTYTYSTEEPGLWVAEKRRFIENKLDIWYPERPPLHPQVVRILKVKPNMLIINHCSETGDGGIFSLILRRSPSKMKRWEWYDIRRQFYSFELPNTYRFTAICASCRFSGSALYLCISFIISISVW
ncbi:hypothetical protein K1T71_003374 [Dendrolimus kikuchii]|uniref:Uncharacterized protein n=1 Tax=Dendrolimus kikuchii TaxID=765133 RepID=A0ACC1DBH5_9NEOP|nr:hypothetical protein K1T71_003374 [Dendrolimus kikuchii]